MSAAALFAMIGAIPHTGRLAGEMLRDQHGFILPPWKPGRRAVCLCIASARRERPFWPRTVRHTWWRFVTAIQDRYGPMVAGSCLPLDRRQGPGFVHCVEEVLVASVIALDVNETLLDMHALDEPFEVLLGSASLRPQWFALMLQLAFAGGLTGQYVDFTTAQRAVRAR